MKPQDFAKLEAEQEVWFTVGHGLKKTVGKGVVICPPEMSMVKLRVILFLEKGAESNIKINDELDLKYPQLL